MAATLRDVAEQAGVSQTVASCVMSGRYTSTRVSEETKIRVRAVARELNYRPNALARGLARKQTNTISLVLKYAQIFANRTGFTTDLMHGACEAALQAHYDLLLHTNEAQDLEQEIAAITDARTDGALLLRYRDDPLIAHLKQREFPFVLMFCRSTDPDVWFVECDNVYGGRIATEHLLQLGHRRILYLAGDPRDSNWADRRTGYEQAMQDHGIAPLPECIIEEPYDRSARSRLEAILRAPDRPTAVFACADWAAFWMMRVAKEMRLRIPGDLSLIGFDSSAQCNETSPRLTSVRQPISEMAAYAVTMLIQKLRGETVVETRKLFEPVVEQRRSCAPPRSKQHP